MTVISLRKKANTRTKARQNRTHRVGCVSGRAHTKDWDIIARITPFLITKSSKNPLKRAYGPYHMRIKSELREEDYRVWLAIKDLSPEPGRLFAFTITDIAKEMGLSNPYDPNAQDRIRESVERLLEAEVRIYYREKGNKSKLRAKFSFLTEGILYQGENGKVIGGKVSISNLLTAMDEAKSGYFFLDKRLIFTLQRPVARNLYRFLRSQKFLSSKIPKPYSISMLKLLNYIGYELVERAPWYLWKYTLQPAIDELKTHGVISSCDIKPKGRGEDRVITFHPPEPKLRQKKPKAIEMDETFQRFTLPRIKDKIEELDPAVKRPYDEGELVERILELEKRIKSTDISILQFVEYYLRWLVWEHRIRYFTPALFKPSNPLVKGFVESNIARDLVDSLSDYEKLKQCIYEGKKKREKKEENGVELTMEDITAEPKLIEEEEEEWVRFYKRRECPFGKRYGADYEPKEDICDKCRQTYPQLYDACMAEWDKMELAGAFDD